MEMTTLKVMTKRLPFNPRMPIISGTLSYDDMSSAMDELLQNEYMPDTITVSPYLVTRIMLAADDKAACECLEWLQYMAVLRVQGVSWDWVKA